MEAILTKLRALGVHIPEGLDSSALVRLAKLLCPWTLTVDSIQEAQDVYYRAYTRKDQTADVAEASTPELAAFTLLHLQLQAGKYSAQDTTYKTSSMAYRAN